MKFLPILLLFLAGCATPYRSALSDFEQGQRTAYLDTAIRPIAHGNPPVAESANIDIPDAQTATTTASWLDQNPTVQAAKSALIATRAQYSQTEALSERLREYRAFGAPASKADFPFPGATALKGKLVDLDVAIAEQQVAIARRDVANAGLIIAFDDRFVSAALKINAEQQALLEQMIAVAQTKVRTDSGSYRALLDAQAELSRLSNATADLRSQQARLRARQNALRHTGKLVAPAIDSKPLDTWQQAAEKRQELRLSQLHVARTKTRMELARRMTAHGNGDFSFLGEVEQQLVSQRHQLQALEDQTDLAVEEAFRSYTEATDDLALHRDSLVPKARQALEAAAAAYRSSALDFQSYLEAEQSLLKVRLGEQRALREQGIAWAKLLKLTGDIR